jgi:nucleolar protein 16
LNDPLNDLEDENAEEWNGIGEVSTGASTEVVAALEDMAAREKKKEPRKQSVREREWVERLVAKYGDDFRAMSRDTKLNPMQQTEPDIARRVVKWKSESVVA